MAHLAVTGGAGYVGSHALRALRRAGHTAVVFDDLRSGHESFARGAPLYKADVGDRAADDDFFSRFGPFDGLLHFATSGAEETSRTRPLEVWQNDVAGGLQLIRAATLHGVRAFVLSSTTAVYGHPEFQPVPESAPLAPIRPDGAAMATLEQILSDVERSYGMRWIALRYGCACGADAEGGIGESHAPETHLVPRALEAAAGLGPEVRLFGSDYPTRDGTCIRDYLHVSDVADAHVRAIEGLLAGGPGGPYNLGTGRGLSHREVLAAVGAALGRPVPHRELGRREGDVAELVADASRFRRDFDWAPSRSDLDTLVASAWAWLRSLRRGEPG